MTHQEWMAVRERLRPERQKKALADLRTQFPDIKFVLVPNFPDYVCSEYGEVYYTNRPHKPLKPRISRGGYTRLCLSVNGTSPTRSIHRIVADCFLPPPKKGQDQINHIDGNKLNNHYTNLEWCDSTHNIRHAVRLGLKRGLPGVEHHQAKLDEAQVRTIRSLRGETSIKELSRYFKISNSVICAIQAGIAWKHLN